MKGMKEHWKLVVYSSGVAVIKDSSTGCEMSLHPKIDATGSVKGMRSSGYWGKDDTVVRAGGGYYNIEGGPIHDHFG